MKKLMIPFVLVFSSLLAGDTAPAPAPVTPAPAAEVAKPEASAPKEEPKAGQADAGDAKDSGKEAPKEAAKPDEETPAAAEPSEEVKLPETWYEWLVLACLVIYGVYNEIRKRQAAGKAATAQEMLAIARDEMSRRLPAEAMAKVDEQLAKVKKGAGILEKLDKDK